MHTGNTRYGIWADGALMACLLLSSLTTDVTPSFILLAIQGRKVVTYVYELHGDQVDVSKSEFSKN